MGEEDSTGDARDDFRSLEEMIYSGRGIIVGRTPAGNPFIGYSLTGRSTPSQARELILGKNPKTGETSNTIRTSVTNREELEKGSPALLLYPAFTAFDGMLMASNGAQTELIYSAARNCADRRLTGIIRPDTLLIKAFAEPAWRYDQKEDRWIDITTFEPDAPNNTPRISACVLGDSAGTHIVRCLDGRRSEEVHYFNLVAGQGWLMTTYSGGNESPLASFEGHAKNVLIVSETPEKIAENIYAAIQGGANEGDNYRVSAAVGMLNRTTGEVSTSIINRVQRGS